MRPNLYTIEVKGKRPFVVLGLKEYQSMLEHLEDIEDKLAISERINEENIPWENTEKKLIKKFDLK